MHLMQVLRQIIMSYIGNLQIVSTEKSPPWEASSHSASQEISRLYRTRRFITVFKRASQFRGPV
jgi:hypothetical protein